jgi:hypothetical protein
MQPAAEVLATSGLLIVANESGSRQILERHPHPRTGRSTNIPRNLLAVCCPAQQARVCGAVEFTERKKLRGCRLASRDRNGTHPRYTDRRSPRCAQGHAACKSRRGSGRQSSPRRGHRRPQERRRHAKEALHVEAGPPVPTRANPLSRLAASTFGSHRARSAPSDLVLGAAVSTNSSTRPILQQKAKIVP